MESNAANSYRQLAYRASDGVAVILYWHQGTEELLVSVSDEGNGAYFELHAGPDQALDVFYHPYAHAAFRGLPYEQASFAGRTQACAAEGQNRPDFSDKPTR